MRYVGVSVKGSGINLAVIDRELGSEGHGSALPNAFSRESFSGDSSDPSRLLELTQKLRQDLRDWSVQGVVLVETTKYSNWVYKQVQQRVLCIAAMMIATAEESVRYEVSKPATVGAHLLSPKLENLEPKTFGLQATPKYWTTGAREAYAAAAFAARDR